MKPLVTADHWQALRQLTPARLALGRAGSSLPTQAQLDFQLAHARARDAVHHELGLDALAHTLQTQGHRLLKVQSQANDRRTYLQRPDKGRRLSEHSRLELQALATEQTDSADLLLIVADGLSPLAVELQAARFIATLKPLLESASLRIAPLVLATQARVALGDEVAELMGAQMVAILIGERPGLSSPDSMGIYLTYQARVGTTDAQRNCISNIRSEGLSDEEAVNKLMYLILEGRRRQLTGVELKEEAPAPGLVLRV
jgi:ethanolamine ammonia-lyase small subunit